MKGVQKLIVIGMMIFITGCSIESRQVHNEIDHLPPIKKSGENKENKPSIQPLAINGEGQWVEIEDFKVNVPAGWDFSIDIDQETLVLTKENMDTVICIGKTIVEEDVLENTTLTAGNSIVETGKVKDLNYVRINTPPQIYDKEDLTNLIEENKITNIDIETIGGEEEALRWFNKQQKASQYIYIPINDQTIMSIMAVIGVGEEEQVKGVMDKILESISVIKPEPNKGPKEDSSKVEKPIGQKNE